VPIPKLQQLRTFERVTNDTSGFRTLIKPNVGSGSWLRDNALARSATVRDPVNVVRHGPFERFFLLDDQDRF